MHDEDRQLWDLLGRSPRPAAPPFFAAKVQRLIEAPRRPRAFLPAPLLRWLAPTAVAALFVAALLAPTANEPAPVEKLTTLDLLEILSPEDYEILTTAGWSDHQNFLTAGL